MTRPRPDIPARRGPAAFLGDRAGVVSVETAFLLVFAVVLALGLYDMGQYAIEQARAESAVRAGTQYAMRGPAEAANTDAVEAAARHDLAGAAERFSVDARRFCACGGTAAADEVACSLDCPDGGYAPMYAEVTVTGAVGFIWRYPGVDDPAPVGAVSRLRIR